MSSTITIGFLDRTRVCIQTEFTAPLADDERRELLIHAALLTGRAFASLSYERQRSLVGVLREWVAARFATCPLQIVDGDPMACQHRFASTFLAPVREYALATTGCNKEAGGIDYFLPMAAAAYLRHVTVTDHDPEELLKPALALCAAVAIQPITVANHFQMAAASLPKFAPVVDRTEPADPVGDVRLAKRESRRRLLETRRSLLVSACLAALMIVLGVQFLSTRDPKAGGETAAVPNPTKPQSVPKPMPPQPLPSPKTAPIPQAAVGSSSEGRLTKPPSPKVRAYLRKVRDLAENSLAQVEVMLTESDRKGMETGDTTETLDYGIRQLQTWHRQFAALTPPREFQDVHHEIGRLLIDLGHIVQRLRSQQAEQSPGAVRERLSALHDHLEQILNDADAI